MPLEDHLMMGIGTTPELDPGKPWLGVGQGHRLSHELIAGEPCTHAILNQVSTASRVSSVSLVWHTGLGSWTLNCAKAWILQSRALQHEEGSLAKNGQVCGCQAQVYGVLRWGRARHRLERAGGWAGSWSQTAPPPMAPGSSTELRPLTLWKHKHNYIWT